MSQLTSPLPRTLELDGRNFQDYPMVSNVTIYQGSAVSDSGSPGSATNTAHQLVAGENFLGFANATVTNASGGSSTINVITTGVVKLSVTGVSSTSLGAEVYASDGNTFTLTSSANSAIGRVVNIISGTTCLVRFTGLPYKSI